MNYVEYEGVPYFVDTRNNKAYVGNGSQLNVCPTNLIIQPSIQYEGKKYNVTEIQRFTFRYCNKIKTISIPDGIKRIGLMAFYVSGFKADVLELPRSLEYLDGLAFPHNALTDVKIGPNLKEVGDSVFARTNVKKFIVDEENQYICNDDQYCLYTKDMTALIAAGGFVDDLVIPPTVTQLYAQSIDGISIKTLTLPRLLDINTTRDASYIYFCRNLIKITIIGDIKEAQVKALFINTCPSVSSIYYYGKTVPGANFFNASLIRPNIFVVEKNITMINTINTIYLPHYTQPIKSCKANLYHHIDLRAYLYVIIFLGDD